MGSDRYKKQVSVKRLRKKFLNFVSNGRHFKKTGVYYWGVRSEQKKKPRNETGKVT